MKIHIIGAGSLGLLFGGRLAASGADVTFWCRTNEQVEQLRLKGITVTKDHKSIHISPGFFRAEPMSKYHELGGAGEEDCIFLMVKQTVLNSVIKELFAPYSLRHLKLLCFQNGTGHIEQLREHLPAWTLYAAVTTEGAKRSGLAEVIHAGDGSTWIGQAGDDVSNKKADIIKGSELEKELTAQLEIAGFEVFLSKELDTMIYRKLLMNAVINPLTALWRITNGELLESEKRISLMRELYEEGIAVYEACNIPWEKNLWDQILQVCQSTSGNTSSMLKDVLDGRKTEVSSINGSIVRMAERIGGSAPTHRLIWRLIEGIHVKEA
ncbi:ketopantoate reductase family protein [Paenibacillus faecalis]|uniref:ketopantoate reductase family protein n=1 Tax=Paenibacillus faecalis TaxID=2079532 RepID=UPI000D108A3E|nr:2-dehydropantoate 2-reductase [Paenibacillus faecalis]